MILILVLFLLYNKYDHKCAKHNGSLIQQTIQMIATEMKSLLVFALVQYNNYLL